MSFFEYILVFSLSFLIGFFVIFPILEIIYDFFLGFFDKGAGDYPQIAERENTTVHNQKNGQSGASLSSLEAPKSSPNQQSNLAHIRHYWFSKERANQKGQNLSSSLLFKGGLND